MKKPRASKRGSSEKPAQSSPERKSRKKRLEAHAAGWPVPMRPNTAHARALVQAQAQVGTRSNPDPTDVFFFPGFAWSHGVARTMGL